MTSLCQTGFLTYSSVNIPYLAPLCLLYPSPFHQSLACYPTGYEPGADEFPTRRITDYILVLQGIVRARQLATFKDTVNLASNSMTRSLDQLGKVSAKDGTIRPHLCLDIVDRQNRQLRGGREDLLPREFLSGPNLRKMLLYYFIFRSHLSSYCVGVTAIIKWVDTVMKTTSRTLARGYDKFEKEIWPFNSSSQYLLCWE